MLKEIREVRQIKGEPRRRWFASDNMDLIVWLDHEQAPIGFQLCYRNGNEEKALTWTTESGYSHMDVDSGEQNLGTQYKGTPILTSGSTADIAMLAVLFMSNSEHVPKKIKKIVTVKIAEYGS